MTLILGRRLCKTQISPFFRIQKNYPAGNVQSFGGDNYLLDENFDRYFTYCKEIKGVLIYSFFFRARKRGEWE